MNNKLFLLCPKARLEGRIHQQIEGNHYFMTSLGGDFDFEDPNFQAELDYLIKREGISEVCLVSEADKAVNAVTKVQKIAEQPILRERHIPLKNLVYDNAREQFQERMMVHGF
ncbi:MAG: hypothetical protein AB8F95_19355 [Bacteroidia bacterium]